MPSMRPRLPQQNLMHRVTSRPFAPMLTPYMPWYGYPTASISPLQAVMGQCRCGRQSDCSTLKWVLLVTVPRTVLDDAVASPSAPSPLHGEGAEGEASVSQDHRKCLRTASVRQDQRQYLEMGPGNDAANLEMGPGNDAGASTDSVRQARPKEVLSLTSL